MTVPTVDTNPKSSTGNSDRLVQRSEIFHEQNQRQCVNAHPSNSKLLSQVKRW